MIKSISGLSGDQWFGMFFATCIAQAIGVFLFNDSTVVRIGLSIIFSAIACGVIGKIQSRVVPPFRVAKNAITNEYRLESLQRRGLTASRDRYARYGHGTYRDEAEAIREMKRETRNLLITNSWEGLHEAKN